MATAFSHAIAAVSLGTAFPRPKSSRFWGYGMICAAAPDLDVIGFRFGIEYGDLLGHRGLSHSIAFAVVLSGLVAAAIASVEPVTRLRVLWLYLFLATASHGVLDAFTNGGLGVAFFAPFVNTRYFFSAQPIQVSPIGVREFFTANGLAIVANEARWIWLPAGVFAALMLLGRSLLRQKRSPGR